jgi:anti-anti-sigma regulatory factor
MSRPQRRHMLEGSTSTVAAPGPYGADPAEDDDLDVRLHSPRPDTVVVWAAGTLHTRSAPLLATRVRQQLHRAAHVVLDLSSVTSADPEALASLATLWRTAQRTGTRLHVAVENGPLAERIRLLGLGHDVVIGPADAVVAALPLW